ncbi:unnamed protein product [Phytophthora fragariaefolia]|uniref:Unnamed protein product n=1 Tax=Phytophthora fragariaefolia TaxID=1490495 RepID=A0A9W7CVA4_9STRA|nr:unnamed protein product [Phytophthora fragariaefolia]
MSDQNDKFHDEAVRLLLLGVTDLWSAIRKDCTKAAATIAFKFSSERHIELFIDGLLCVAIGARSISSDKSQVTAWTEREGALLALSIILHSIEADSTNRPYADEIKIKVFHVKDDIKGFLGASASLAVKYRLGQRHTLTQLPKCMVQTMKPVMYQCLRHDQLSVRQLAAECLVQYAALCEDPTRLLIFQEVISKLNRINRNENNEIDTTMDPRESELLDAFEAEGMLDVLARMVPYLPPSFLLKHWKIIFPTLEKYVVHVASSVRQKSSTVVSALAEVHLRNPSHHGAGEVVLNPTSLYSNTSIRLVIQMLISLSKQPSDESGMCWQQKEGRLLSIDVLITVLSESLLVCPCKICMLLKWKPASAQSRHLKAGSLAQLQSLPWAHAQVQIATWVSNNVDQGGQSNALAAKYGKTECSSLIHDIGIWVEKSGEQNEVSSQPGEFWYLVLGGCIAQTKVAFESSQYELRRISRQVLPGLMRLVVWTEQQELILSTARNTSTEQSSWFWTCAKYILLHLRYLEESTKALGETTKQSTFCELVVKLKSVWNGIVDLESSSCDVDTIVAQVEANLIAFLSFGAAIESSQHVIGFLDRALRLIHMHLPETVQLRRLFRAKTTSDSNDNSLDRQFCIFMVPIFSLVVATAQYLGGSSSTVDGAESNDEELSWSSRYLCLERIALAWLSSDEMFRWITLNKFDAQSILLQSLSELLRCMETNLSCAEEGEDVDRVLQCIDNIFSAARNTRLKDSTYSSLVSIYVRLWLRSVKCRTHNTSKVAIAATHLYSHRQQYLTYMKANPIACIACPTAQTWDDWDDDDGEVLQACPVEELQQPRDLSVPDTLFQEVLESLNATQLDMLYEASCAVPNLAEVQVVPAQHITRMQEQIKACLQD